MICGSACLVVGCPSCGRGTAKPRGWFSSRAVCAYCGASPADRIPGSAFPQLGRGWPRPARELLDGARRLLQRGASFVERPFGPEWQAPGVVRWIVGLTWTVLVVILVYLVGGWPGVAIAAVVFVAAVAVAVRRFDV